MKLSPSSSHLQLQQIKRGLFSLITFSIPLHFSLIHIPYLSPSTFCHQGSLLLAIPSTLPLREPIPCVTTQVYQGIGQYHYTPLVQKCVRVHTGCWLLAVDPPLAAIHSRLRAHRLALEALHYLTTLHYPKSISLVHPWSSPVRSLSGLVRLALPSSPSVLSLALVFSVHGTKYNIHTSLPSHCFECLVAGGARVLTYPCWLGASRLVWFRFVSTYTYTTPTSHAVLQHTHPWSPSHWTHPRPTIKPTEVLLLL